MEYVQQASTEPGQDMAPANPAIVLEGVTRTFKSGSLVTTALKNLSIKIRPGIVTGLIGPDGAGKTTFMRLCAGLLRPDKGSVTVLGTDVARSTLHVQLKIGYMPQRFALYEDLTVQENMDLYADLQGVPVNVRKERFAQLLDMAGMAPFTSRLAGRLSGGMKQKLGLICTLVRAPSLLLLDEPTVGVDPVSRRELWAIVYRLVEHEKMSVLLSTAYLDEAERCTEVALLHNGELLGQGPPDAFSKEVQGRAWTVTGFRQEKRRGLQIMLSDLPWVVDALILGQSIRLVTAPGMHAPSLVAKTVPESKWGKLVVESVPPRFEDCFIARLKGSRKDEEISRDIRLEHPIQVDAHREIIVVRDLKRRFGDFYAVNGINFSVRQGEVFGLLGANGAGKTTTFRMLCGLLPISDGTCLVAGKDLRKAGSEARRRIGYMAQKFSLYGEISVRQNLNFFSSVYGLKGRHRRRQIEWAMDTFELHQYASTKAHLLPLGFKQRLALAAALMHEPSILFLDEPTSGVDPLARREFWRHINNLVRQGVTVLVTTHFMEEAEYCDRLVIMAGGKVLAEGTPEDLKAKCPSGERGEVTMEDAFIYLLEQMENRV